MMWSTKVSATTHLQVLALGIASVWMTGCAGLPGLSGLPTVGKSNIAVPQPTQPATKADTAARSNAVRVSDMSDESVQPPIAQVGFLQPKCLACQSDSCEDASCQDACPTQCQVVPHGYAQVMVPQPWRYDPQEFLCDGGDASPKANLSRDNRFLGLQPEDTLAHYTTESGETQLTASNRVCVYSPRFGSIRRITGTAGKDIAIAASGYERPVGPRGVDVDLPGLVMSDTTHIGSSEYTRRIDSMRDRNRGVRIENIQQVNQAADVLEILANIQDVSLTQIDEAQLAVVEQLAIAASSWTMDESVEVEILDLAPPVLTRDERVDALTVYDFPDKGRLNLIKLADKHHAAIGDTVTFALRLQNVGDSAVSGVVVTDNLTTRLEYVADSQIASVDADFETDSNSADSAQLIWRIKETLEVGDTVTIEFKCKIR